jgi:hypothetical protein
MIGIFITLVAVLLVICFAFYYTEHPSGRGARAEALFFATRTIPPKKPEKFKRQESDTLDR